MSTKNELIRRLRSGDVTAIDELRERDFLSATSNRTFGIEIECVFPNIESVHNFINDVNSNTSLLVRDSGYTHTTTPHWKVVTDASIHSSARGRVGREIVSPILKGAQGKQDLKTIIMAPK